MHAAGYTARDWRRYQLGGWVGGSSETRTLNAPRAPWRRPTGTYGRAALSVSAPRTTWVAEVGRRGPADMNVEVAKKWIEKGYVWEKCLLALSVVVLLSYQWISSAPPWIMAMFFLFFFWIHLDSKCFVLAKEGRPLQFHMKIWYDLWQHYQTTPTKDSGNLHQILHSGRPMFY